MRYYVIFTTIINMPQKSWQILCLSSALTINLLLVYMCSDPVTIKPQTKKYANVLCMEVGTSICVT